VINDVNVTGTQQDFLWRALEPTQPSGIYWLYIVQVDPVLGRTNPEIEFALNNVRLKSFEEFAEVVLRADIDFTARCISRLFLYPDSMLEPLIRSMDQTRRKRLRQLVTDEGGFAGDEIRSKVALLQEIGTAS
jgi:hypothetical protein